MRMVGTHYLRVLVIFDVGAKSGGCQYCTGGEEDVDEDLEVHGERGGLEILGLMLYIYVCFLGL